jgi:hypothetical protein
MTHSEDLRGHTGVMVKLGSGFIHGESKRQSITAMSSAESELIALNSASNAVLWLRRLMSELGFKQAQPTIVRQDNTSAMSIAESGCTARTRHIALRYFRVSELIKAGEIQIEYERTDKLVADVLTKALSDPSFSMHRKELLNDQRDKSSGDAELKGVLDEEPGQQLPTVAGTKVEAPPLMDGND